MFMLKIKTEWLLTMERSKTDSMKNQKSQRDQASDSAISRTRFDSVQEYVSIRADL